jgi:hypothetical protein
MRQYGYMTWEAVTGTAVLTSALTWVTSNLAAKRAAVDARHHWEQGTKLRESAEQFLHAANAYNGLAFEAMLRYYGTGPALTADEDVALDLALTEVAASLRTLRLDVGEELMPTLDEIAWRARLLSQWARGEVRAIRPEYFQRSGNNNQPNCTGILPAFTQAVSAFEAGARASLGHTSSRRRHPGQSLRATAIHSASRMRR